MQNGNLYWVWLATRLGAASVDFPRLMMHYENPYDIYTAPAEELEALGVLSKKSIDALADKRLEQAFKIVEFCSKTGVGILNYSDPSYPNRLRLLRDAPVLLYVRGNMPQMDRRLCIGMVGTRRMSEYGRNCAYKIAYELGAARVVTVSGMALGIDGVSACGTIKGHGETVAVLGCGIDVVYPKEHARLAEIISQNGAVVTEYSPGTPPIGEHFPVRNRIISGMCQGTLIVEADMRSGAMITARTASSQGRQVFAIPGNLGETNTSGTNMLIRDGGIVVLEAEDILAEYSKIYEDFIDIPRLKAARQKYYFNEEELERLGVGARFSKDRAGTTSNKPSAPREAFAVRSRHGNNVKDHETPDDIPLIPEENPVSELKVAAKTPVIENAVGDNSEELLASLSETQRRLFSEIPDDRAITTDALTKLGYSIGEVMSAMTLMEIKGLVSSLPGGLYLKR